MLYDPKNPKIWFFHTVDEYSSSAKDSVPVPRLRMLPYQYVPCSSKDSGEYELCDCTLNTESDMEPRKNNPVGTIFASKFVTTKLSSRGTEFYSIKGTVDGQPNRLISLNSLSEESSIVLSFKEYSKYVENQSEKKTKEKKTDSPVTSSVIDTLLTKFPAPTVEDDNFYVNKDVWACMLFNIHQGYNTMLVGDSGTGKTELSMFIGSRMGKSVKVFDMAAKQDPIASLVGVHRFDGKSVFDRADFTYAIEEDGIVVLDELPRAPMNTNNILFPVLDSRRELNMDIASHGMRSIKVNPNCRFVATANEGYEYTGNNVLDRALKERFQLINVGYMPEAQEINLLHKRTNIDKNSAKIIVTIGRTIRDLSKKEEISNSVSIRHTLYAADLCANGMPVTKAMESAFIPLFKIEDEIKKIKDLFASR